MIGGEPKSPSPSTISIGMQAQTSSQLYPPSPLSLPAFEFTKRKRWADLLITELTEAIILILSTQCQILYCSSAVKELLGWRDEDLIDTEFLDLVNGAWMCPVQSLTPLSFTVGLSPQLTTGKTSRETLSYPSGTTPICNPTSECEQNPKLRRLPPPPAPQNPRQMRLRCCSKSTDILTS